MAKRLAHKDDEGKVWAKSKAKDKLVQLLLNGRVPLSAAGMVVWDRALFTISRMVVYCCTNSPIRTSASIQSSQSLYSWTKTPCWNSFFFLPVDFSFAKFSTLWPTVMSRSDDFLFKPYCITWLLTCDNGPQGNGYFFKRKFSYLGEDSPN